MSKLRWRFEHWCRLGSISALTNLSKPLSIFNHFQYLKTRRRKKTGQCYQPFSHMAVSQIPTIRSTLPVISFEHHLYNNFHKSQFSRPKPPLHFSLFVGSILSLQIYAFNFNFFFSSFFFCLCKQCRTSETSLSQLL